MATYAYYNLEFYSPVRGRKHFTSDTISITFQHLEFYSPVRGRKHLNLRFVQMLNPNLEFYSPVRGRKHVCHEGFFAFVIIWNSIAP